LLCWVFTEYLLSTEKYFFNKIPLDKRYSDSQRQYLSLKGCDKNTGGLEHYNVLSDFFPKRLIVFAYLKLWAVAGSWPGMSYVGD
jgi:hypothetical protein